MQNDVINRTSNQPNPTQSQPLPAPLPLPLDSDLLKQVSGGDGLPRGNW